MAFLLKIAISIFIALFLGCSNEPIWVMSAPANDVLSLRIKNLGHKLNLMGFSLNINKINLREAKPKEMALIFFALNNRFTNDPSQKSKLFSSNRLAFYDPNSKSIVVRSNLENRISDGYLAHELIHVYQDQKWDFDKLWQIYKTTPCTENYNIAQYLIEGHAEIGRQALEQNLASSKFEQTLIINDFSDIISNDCLYCDKSHPINNLPYKMGLRFFGQVFASGGWSLVENIFDNIPISTEQILHPNKLYQDYPRIVTLPYWREAKARMVFEGTMGEAYLLQKLLSMNIDPKIAYIAASGWDGDFARSYITAWDEEILFWRIVFDRPKDAEQLKSALVKSWRSISALTKGNVFYWIEAKSKKIRRALRKLAEDSEVNYPTNSDDAKSTAEQEIKILLESTKK